ncbi:MAG: UDP-N-acetylmuramoyl-tripeptide--D-alanyl-D-alanine ligase [Paludibacter sp.]
MTIAELYVIFQKHSEVSTDSRNCPAGCLFFALKGDNFNANAFAHSALSNGAAYAVIDEATFAVDNRYILVENVLETLQQLARYHRKQLNPIVLGITGTNGKTTSKELIASVLIQKFNILFTQGNLNNHIGVPLTLLKLKNEHKLAVIEMGASKQGDIKELVEIACPDYGIITNVGKAHLEGFGSFEGVKSTKAELYDFILNHGKLIFKNADNEHLTEMALKSGFTSNDKICNYSLEKSANNSCVTASIESCSPFLTMNCATSETDRFTVSTKLIGSYNAENILAAVTIGHFFGIDNELIKVGLETYTPQNNRSQLTVTERNKLVVDAYNANPTSMRAAVINFEQMQVDNKMLILGDMLELGAQSEMEHQAVIDLLENSKLTNVFLVGTLFEQTNNHFTCFQQVEQLMQLLEQKQIKNHYILIKGSRGIKLEKVISLL